MPKMPPAPRSEGVSSALASPGVVGSPSFPFGTPASSSTHFLVGTGSSLTNSTVLSMSTELGYDATSPPSGGMHGSPGASPVRRHTVGEYELGKTIGKGAYSKVKLCVHLPTGKTWVAKILPIASDVETEVRREISILRRVRHPNIVQLKEILQSTNNFYIILEPVQGGDLCSLIMKHENGLGESRTAIFFDQLVDALAACHQVGVAHRDLKPENILLTEDGECVKVSDFGLSRLHRKSQAVARPEEFATTLTGTLAYVAPEVLSRHYDAFKADIWSLGCILYVMLTCRFPFGSTTGDELKERINNGAFNTMPSTVPPDARDLVAKMLHPEPEKRIGLTQIREHPFLRGIPAAIVGPTQQTLSQAGTPISPPRAPSSGQL